jgi:hypothetical protein
VCAHYFELIIIDGQIAIVDFGINCSLDSRTGELASDGAIL